MNKKLRVLNVEDSENDTALLSRHLNKSGYDAFLKRVETPDALTAALESEAWDLIVCDYTLPQFDALSALAIVKDSGIDVPVVIVSGTVDELAGVAAMKAGANDYFLKSNLVRLGATIERELQESENRRLRKNAEAALRASEKELRALFSAMTDIVFELDSDGRYLKVAPTNPAYLYRNPDDLIGKTMHEVFDKVDADSYLEYIREALRTRSVVRVEYKLKIKGVETWFDGSVSPMTATSVIWISRDITQRKKAEQEQILGKLRLAEAQSLARMGSWDWDLESNVMTWSDEHYRLYGLEPGSIDISFDAGIVRAYIHSDDRDLLNERVAHIARTGEPFSFDYRVCRPDGEERIIHSRADAELNTAGKPTRIFGTAQDVTERRRAYIEKSRLVNELEGQRSRIRDIVESVPGVVWEAWGRPDEVRQDVGFVSDHVTELLGYPKEELVSAPNFWMSIVHPDDRPRAVRDAVASFETGTDRTFEFRSIAKDGRVISVETRAVVIKNEKGESVGMRGVTIDVSERHETEQLLREQKEILQQVFEHIPVMISFIGRDGRRRLVNREWKHVLGWTQEEAVSHDFDILVESYPDPLEQQRARDHIAAASGEWKEFKSLSKDGQIKDCLWAIVGLSDGTSVAIGQDITERKRSELALHETEMQLRQGQKMEAIGRLAGGIAHDFNNLLTVITGYSDLAIRRMAESDPLRRNCEEIKKAGERAAALTGQLLAFSRKQVLQPKILNINSVISGMADMLRRVIGEDIELCTELSEDIGSVRADPGQIEQVIMNLAVNSRDATPMAGELRIKTKNIWFDPHTTETEPGDHVMIEICDTGIGMDEELQSRIFDPFFTTKPVGQGTGLGLSTVYGIINQSGGHIDVDSEVGKGTTFRIYLPRLENEVAADVVPNAVEQSSLYGSETILLAEDEDVVRNLAREVLESYGYNVIDARNGVEAVAVSRDHKGVMDMLISDVVMPGMGGRELRDAVLTSRPGMKVLFMSGYTDDAVVRYGVFESKMPFIQKPFTPEGFASKVREVLDKG